MKITFFLTLLITSLSADAFTLEGKVLDKETQQPVSNINILFDGNGTTTNLEGEYSLLLDKPETEITFSHIGYEKKTVLAGDLPPILYLSPLPIQGINILVRSGLREVSLLNSPASITIMGNDKTDNEPLAHFQSLTHSIPNLNWAGGTSRPRYFQLRGIGGRSLYTGEGPPNFSVGFVMDDIDLSGIGMPANLTDIQQVEILRGPQSAIFGSNAMAGLINMRSKDPKDGFGAEFLGTIGTDNTRKFSYSLNTPVNGDFSNRLTLSSGNEDGFRKNQFKNSSNTNGRNELLIRNKSRYQLSETLNFNLTTLYSKQNNKYDAWAPDNNEELNTFSDKKGRDSQSTTAFSLRTNLNLTEHIQLLSITSYSQNEMEHSYDGDWGNEDYWKNAPYHFDPAVEGWAYDFFDKTERKRNTASEEVRLTVPLFSESTLTGGIYLQSINEDDDASGYLMGGDASEFTGSFNLNTMAVYAEYEQEIIPQLTLSVNSRFEKHSIDYSGDSHNYGADSTTITFKTEDNLTGFKSAVRYALTPSIMVFSSFSRGYKAGGINQNPYLGTTNRSYEPEFNLNYEAGYKSVTSTQQFQFTLFMMQRLNQQVQISSQQEEGNPNSFYFYTANAATGQNSGAEVEWSAWLNDQFQLGIQGGYLKTQVDAYQFKTDSSTTVTLGNREIAHAPPYTVSVNAHYLLTSKLTAGITVNAKDAYYFSDSHNQKSDAYQLVDAHLDYNHDNWGVSLWGKNILDSRYAVRGFYFGLEPPNYEDKLYIHWGDPAQYGVTLNYRF